MKCYLCEENFTPTSEELEAFAHCRWDPANWICPGCEAALDEAGRREASKIAFYEDEEDYEHPF